MPNDTTETKKQYFDKVVAELNLDTRDPFTLLMANAFALCDQRDALERENTGLRSKLGNALLQYGTHRRGCGLFAKVTISCDCGLSDAFALSTDGEMKEEG